MVALLLDKCNRVLFLLVIIVVLIIAVVMDCLY